MKPEPGFEDRHDTRRTIRSVSLGTLWQALRYPFILLSALVIPRQMGDAVYGQFALFVAVYFILDVFSDVGITQVFGRFLPELGAQQSSKAAHLLRGMLAYGMLVTLALVALVVVPLGLLGRIAFSVEWWVVLAALLLLAKVEGTLFSFLYGMNQIGRYATKGLLRSIASFAFVFAGFHWFGLSGALWALVAGEVLLLAMGALWTRPYLLAHPAPMPVREFRTFLVFGLQFYVPMLLFSLLQRSGNILIKGFHGSYADIAHYDVANQFLLLTSTFLGLLLSTTLPAMTALYVRGQEATIRQWYRTILTYCGVVAFLVFSTLALLGRPVIAACLGPDFLPVFPNAMILFPATIPTIIAYAGMNYSIMEKRPSVYVMAVVYGLLAMAAVGVALIPRLGSIGASWANLVGYSVMALSFAIRYRAAFRAVLGPMVKVLLAGCLFAPLLALDLRLPLAAAVLLACILGYVGLLLVLRLVRPADLVDLWRKTRVRG